MSERPNHSVRPTIKDPHILATRRRQLVEAATRVFGAQGFANTSVGQVAEEAGISIGSMYKYVPSKDFLLWMVMDQIYTTLEDKVDFDASSHRDASEKLVDVIRGHLLAADEMSAEIRLMYREYGHLLPEWQKEFISRDERVIRFIEGIIKKGNADREFSCPHTRVAALNAFGTSVWLSLNRWALSKASTDEYIVSQCALMLRSVGASERVIELRVTELEKELAENSAVA